jgi:FG-GAP-like repeat
MLRNKTYLKLFGFIGMCLLLSMAIFVNNASALISQNSTNWYWTSDTNASALAMGDVNGDGQIEVVTAGYNNDGIRWNAQLIVWNVTTLAAEKATGWYWGGDNQATSVAIGDVDGDGGIEIVTGGAYFDGTRWNAQLIVWNGSTLAAKTATGWFWTGNTQISSIAVANITGGLGLDIVTGGAYFDGTRWNAQLIMWSGATLAPERATGWFWTNNTQVSSVAVGNITGGNSLDIVTGGSFLDNTRYNAQLIVWNSSTMAPLKFTSWFWTSDTYVNSIAVGNVTGGNSLDIVTGGSYFDNTRNIASLIIWNGSTMTPQRLTSWYWTSDTYVNFLTIGNFTGGASLDIVTAGSYNDGLRNNAQLINWNSATLSPSTLATWFVTSGTTLSCASILDMGLAGKRIVASGSYFDSVRGNAQLTIWG